MNTTITSLLTLAGLGAFHGLNPGMGWLFAVALGMQEGKRSAVWRAMIPLTLGHLLAIAAAIGVAMLAGIALSPTMLRWPVAALLAVLGVRQLYRHLHPRWAAMRVGMGGLTLWSFLMASAHGAGRIDTSPHGRYGHAGPQCGVPDRDGIRGVGGDGSTRPGTPAEGLDQPGPDLGGGLDSHWGPDGIGMRRS